MELQRLNASNLHWLDWRDGASDLPKRENNPEEELQRIKAFKLPNFEPPYPFKRNKFADSAKAETYRWVEKFKLHEVNSPEEVQLLYKADIPELATVAYVDCGEKELAWTCKYFIWMFFLDDLQDNTTNFCSPDKMLEIFLELNVLLMWAFPDEEQSYKTFKDFLDEGGVSDHTEALTYLSSKMDEARLKPGTVYDTSSPHFHPLCKSFGDLWATLCETMPADFVRRWGLLAQHQLLGNFREIRFRNRPTIPSVDDYLACRRETSAVFSVLALVEFTDKVHLNDEIFYSPEMKRFLLASNDHITWHNDLWSFQKEAVKGDVHNVVIAVSHAEDCSYAEAGMKVYKMMLDRIEDMEKANSDLEKVTPPEYQHAISRYTNWTRTFTAGTHYWHDRSTRYVKYT